MTKAQLIKENQALKQEISLLKFQLEQLKKMLFGPKSERKQSAAVAEQLRLFEDENPPEQREEKKTEVKSYERVKRKAHPGRNALPEHLPEEVVVIEPEEDTTGMAKIGEERTEYVEYSPASLVKKVIIRPKYAERKEGRIVIAPLPERPLEKSIAGPGLLAHMEVSKFVYHQPFYRQLQQIKRQHNLELSPATVNEWHRGICQLLEPLYQRLSQKVLARGYLQADESPIKVLDKNLKGKSHQGYMWVYYSPEERLAFFQYRKGRGNHGPREVLNHYQGYVQCDGYSAYEKVAQKLKEIELVGCWVHARRYFHEAVQSDAQPANEALEFWSELYRHEAMCRELPPVERYQYRLKNQWPIAEALRQWVEVQSETALPKSPLGKALYYFKNQWPKLKKVFEDGRLELDNNLVENKIRPLALGRKNYLFAGNHGGAQNIAIMYSLFGSCLANDVEPFSWLKDVLERIPRHPVNQLDELLPNNRTLP